MMQSRMSACTKPPGKPLRLPNTSRILFEGPLVRGSNHRLAEGQLGGWPHLEHGGAQQLGFQPLVRSLPYLDHCRVVLPFRPSRAQNLARLGAKILAGFLPVPRRADIRSLARQVDAAIPSDLPRRLFLHAVEQASFLLTGGWKNLDLRPLGTLEKVWRRQGVPTLFLSMHHGNWEWLSGVLHVLRPDAIGVARAAHHPLGQGLLRFVRHYHQTPVLYDVQGFKEAHRTLSKGGLVAFLPDQRPPSQGESGVWLGQPTRVTPLPRRWSRSHHPDLWIGHLTPSSPTSYTFELFRYPPEATERWDELLDFHFVPWVLQSPDLHFGFFHRRLVPRETF